MTKKTFRAQKATSPRYPTLNDLRPGALCRWGLAVIGSVLLGGAGCRRTAGEVAARESVKRDAVPAQVPRDPAASLPGAPDGGARREPLRGAGRILAPRLRDGSSKPVKLKGRKNPFEK
jgi:hypothetical protein